MKKKGFTLAEVALTLTAIGILAAMTIPPMIHYTNKKSTIEQLKKTAATLNHAAYNAIVSNGDTPSWPWGSEEGIKYIMKNILTPRLNIAYVCSSEAVASTSRYCTYSVEGLDGTEYNIATDFNAQTRVLLSDGSLIAFSDGFTPVSNSEGGDGSGDGTGGDGSGSGGTDKPVASQSECMTSKSPDAICGVFMVDVNGEKKPNQIGNDVFFYALNLSGSVLPYGANTTPENINEHCSEGSDGRTCAAKIVEGGWDVCYNCTNPYPIKF